jgi:hypothetical protein
MRSPAVGIARYLDSQGFGVHAAPVGWSINAAVEPATPDTCITVYDTGGESPETAEMDRRPTFQVRVRAPNYEQAWNKLSDIVEHLMRVRAVVLDGTRYVAFMPTSDILSVGRDENNRHALTCNFRVPLASAVSPS